MYKKNSWKKNRMCSKHIGKVRYRYISWHVIACTNVRFADSGIVVPHNTENRERMFVCGMRQGHCIRTPVPATINHDSWICYDNGLRYSTYDFWVQCEKRFALFCMYWVTAGATSWPELFMFARVCSCLFVNEFV